MSRSKIVVLMIAVTVGIVGAIVAIGFALGSGESSEDSSPPVARVRLEIRAKPKARITLDGQPIGQTPLSIQVPKGTKEIILVATMIEHVMPMGRRPIERPREMKRTIVPDRDMVIDFVPPPQRIERPEPNE